MKSQIRSPHSGLTESCRKALLPLAVSLALLSASAQATSTGWVNKNKAFLVKSSAVAAAAVDANGTAQSAGSAYSLNSTAHPVLSSDAAVAPLDASKPLHILVSLKPQNEGELDQFNKDVNQPGNIKFGHFLTPAEFKARFAPSDIQVKQVVAHLQANGFHNIVVASNNMQITADGNAANVLGGFHASMKQFNYKGRSVYANDSDVEVPASLDSIVAGVLGVNTAKEFHTLHTPITHSTPAPAVGSYSFNGIQQNSALAKSAAAATASNVGHSPTDFASIYGASSLPAATNTVVGVMMWDDAANVISDLKAFTSANGLATVNTKSVQTTANATYPAATSGSGINDTNSDLVEWDLDSQDIIGTSGGVKQMIFYESPDATDSGIAAAFNRAVTDDLAKVLNVSFGSSESSSGSEYDSSFKQAVAQGQTFSVAAGDEGVYESSGGVIGTASGTVATGPTNVKTNITLSNYSVGDPGNSQYVISVGGTTLSTNGATGWAGETVWNEGVAWADQNSCTTLADKKVRIWATGGGVSQGEAAPSWQTAALGSSVTKRVQPDVAFDAAQATGAIIYLDGVNTQTNCAGQTAPIVVGGTSLASPLFVGLWARIESANNNAIGFPGSNFYQAFSNTSNASLLHDVTSGNNGYNGYGYAAASGWDEATGFGSFDAGKLNTYAQSNWVSGGGTTTNVPPVANFSDTTSGLTATFTDSSTDSDGGIASRSWNFGDGSTSTTTSPSHTYSAAGTYSVALTVTDNAGATNTKTQSVTVSSGSTGGLQNGVALTGLSGAKSAKLNYTVNIPAGASNLTIAITGSTSASNDADLYVKFGSAPTTSSYDCRPYKTGSNESCTVSSPQAGTYYIMLNGYTAFSGVSLKATWN